VPRACAFFGVSRSFFYKWWNRWWEAGRTWNIFQSRSTRPRTIHSKRDSIRDAVRETRVRFGTWGARKIRAYLGTSLSHQTIHEILVEEGLVDAAPRKQRVWRAWARKHGNSLWQTDLKQLTADPTGPWMMTFIDDASRCILACNRTPTTPHVEDILTVLRKAITMWGKPRQILTDHGAQYWSDRGESQFTKELKTLGILHIKAGIRKPTTTGKVERWHRTYGDELVTQCDDPSLIAECLPRYVTVYDTERPHEAIDYEIPLFRYLGSLIREDSIP
jgi:transposase InsO family protein